MAPGGSHSTPLAPPCGQYLHPMGKTGPGHTDGAYRRGTSGGNCFARAKACVAQPAPLRRGIRSHTPKAGMTANMVDAGSVRAAGSRTATACAYSMTSSARASKVGGTGMPSAFAVFRLMTNSKFVACSIGRSAGLAPLRSLST